MVLIVIDIQEYLSEHDRSPFRDWFDALYVEAAAKVSTALTRLSLGNTSNTKGVDASILEFLLAGGTKQRQQNDIAAAKLRWQNYKLRKKGKH